MKSRLSNSRQGKIRTALLRVMDANFNRAKEALRVCEDISRFFFQSRAVSTELKTLRHQLTRILLKFPATYREWLEARDSARDIGKNRWIRDAKKTSFRAVWISNLKRAQEALRVMEEFSKVVSPPRCYDFQRMRFALYELEKKGFRFF